MKKIYQRAVAVALAGTTLLGLGIWHKSHRTIPAPSKAVTQSTDALPTGVSENTLADIRKSLEKQEYHISYDEQKKKLQSPNRNNNIRAYYEPGKLTVQTRVDTTGEGFKVELVNEGVFADGKLLYTPEADAKAEHHENKVQISHNAFTEEFINNEDGVRQNFIIENAPEGTRQSQVKMTAKGLKVEQGSGNELHFYSEAPNSETRNKLVYSDLKCWDSNQKPLNATLAYVDNRIQISVDVAGAAYPVTIDPIIANGTPLNANKILQIHQSYMWLGFSVSSAGDVNGDGYSDVIVGAPHYDLGEDNEGGAFVYKGDASGLTLTAVTFQSNQKDAQMGWSVSSAGDFNGDGFSDVLVGIPYYDKDFVDEGRANLYLGSATFFTSAITAYGLNGGEAGGLMGINVATAGDIDGNGFSDILMAATKTSFGGLVRCYKGNASGVPSSLFTIMIGQPNAQFGYSIAPAGDVDADGYSDIIIGARYYANGQGQDGEGAAFIYRGASTGLQSGSPTIIEGNQYNAGMGNKVSSAGDVNGDGFSDILISASLYDVNIANQKDHGIVNLYLGSLTGISSQQQPSRAFYGQDNSHLGSSIACAGDVNGDGYSDILIGAEYHDNGQFNEGAVFVYHGSKGNVGIVGDPVSMLESNQGDGWFGTAIASAGDVNGDGYSDILIGCYTYDDGQTDEGLVFVYNGSADGIGAKDAQTITNAKPGAKMGLSVASAGDVNGDGYSDILIGAEYHDNGQFNEGAVFVYHGSKGNVGIVGDPVSMLESNQGDGWFGTAIASAGDVNGDGYSDILIGCYTYDDGQTDEGLVFVYNGSADGIGAKDAQTITNAKPGAKMGLSVASAGDVNGDGYDDVVIGAPYFDEGESSEGVAFVYHGSATGLATDLYASKLQKNQANSYFGGSVAGAGDVNGDGYDDILIGAKEYTLGESNEGVVFLYTGSNSGVDDDPAAPLSIQMNKADADFGFSVAGAGDINRDGYADIIIGAPTYTAQGVAFVYFGAMIGLANQVSVTGPTNTHFGEAVSSAGDVNGDGYSDVIVGAWEATFGEQGEGVAFIYHGSSSGLGANYSKRLEGNQLNANFGFSVASAGDVNGDGFSDVIVGARYYDNGESNEGIAKVYYGTIGGINDVLPAPTLLEANIASAYFGSSVNCAGDVNGDGYSDVIAGAPNFSNGQINEGNLFVFHGSPNGIKTTSSFSFENNVAGKFLGRAVAGAGDVNGDGYSDILVGAPGVDNGQAVDVGATYVYYGNNGQGLRNNVRLYNSDQITPINHNQFSDSGFGIGIFTKSFLGVNKGKLVVETKASGTPFSKVGTNPITTSTETQYIFPNFLNVPKTGTEFKINRPKDGIATRVRARVRYSPVLAITGQMYGPWRYVQRQLAGYNNAPVPEEAMAETIKRKAEPEIETSVSLFPNPASNHLSIQVADPSDIRAVRLYNTSGTPVFQSQRYEKDIDVSKLPGGVYILMLNRANGTPTSHRILIRR